MTEKLSFIMDVKEVRRLNLQYLIASVGKVDDFSKLVGLESPNYVSQLKNGSNNKTMGDKFARKIEKAFDKPKGWMDKLQFSDDNDERTFLTDKEILAQAVKRVLNSLIEAGVYEPKKAMDTEIIVNLIVNNYKMLTSQSDASHEANELRRG